MNVDFSIPVAPVPQMPPGAAPQIAAAGSAAKTLASRLVVDVTARAGGAQGIPDAVVGQDIVATAQWFGGPLLQQLALQLQPIIEQAVQNAVQNAVPPAVQNAVQNAVPPAVQNAVQIAVPPAVQNAVQNAVPPAVQNAVQIAVPPAVQNAVQPLHELLVGECNFTKRLHNRTHQGGNNAQLVPLRKERHPQPAAPPAAVFGALPLAGVFPATLVAVGQLSHAQLDTLAAFYEENFGAQHMPRAQRCDLLVDFITRV